MAGRRTFIFERETNAIGTQDHPAADRRHRRAGALAGFAAPALADVALQPRRRLLAWLDSRYNRPNMRYDYHPDDWYFHRHWEDRDKLHWRGYHEKAREGYWRNGVWITF